jgi:multiple sugar transport system permease protein
MLRALLPGRSPYFYQNAAGLFFAVPAVAFLLVFSVYPLLNAIVLSFTSWNLSGTPTFIGLDNFADLLDDIEVWRSVSVTAQYTLGLVIPGFVISLCLALMFNRNMRGRDLLRTAYFTPVAISWVIASLVWVSVLHPSFGLNAQVMRAFGQPSIPFLTDAKWVIPAMILLSLWKSVGYWMVVFLAGLQGVPQEMYEAASVDGANRWQQFWRITLPLLRPTILFVSVVGVINAFQAFTPVWILTKGGPAGASRVYALLIYQTAFTYFKMGYASALAVVLFIFLMILTLIQMRTLRSDTY